MFNTIFGKAKFPSIEEIQNKYVQFKNYINGEGRFLFDVVMTQESAFLAIYVTEAYEFPAVAGVAFQCIKAIHKLGLEKPTDFQKQFIGALVCELMRVNGYEKTGKKRAVPNKYFTKGEFYKLKAE